MSSRLYFRNVTIEASKGQEATWTPGWPRPKCCLRCGRALVDGGCPDEECCAKECERRLTAPTDGLGLYRGGKRIRDVAHTLSSDHDGCRVAVSDSLLDAKDGDTLAYEQDGVVMYTSAPLQVGRS